MKTRGNKKYFIMNIVAVTLVLLVTAFMFIYFNKTNSTVAAGENTIEIQVDKVTTVSIYAFGDGVELVESTNDHDIYTAEVGTTVRLQAVNETRIFSNWVVEKLNEGDVPAITDLDLNNHIINFTVTESMANLSITVNRRNATAEDYGKYMMDRFVIVDEADLIALQNILDGNGTDSDYALFYENPETYNDDIKKAALKENLRFGYFLISNNFTVFNEKFTGLGTKTEPFQGIVCGKNNTNSRIFLTINSVETPGESSYGLFKYLGNEALIRNLNVTTSIGIHSPNEESLTNDDRNAYATNAPIIYAGGLVGVMDRSTLIDVSVSTSIGIDSTYASDINAGGLFGNVKAGSGIDSISDVTYDGTDSSWSIVSHKEDSIVNAGLIAGTAVDSYIKEVDLIVTNQIVDLKNDSVTNSYTNSKLYLGNVFGTYIADNETETIDDIMIMGDSGESLRAVTSNGDAAVGGLIGYVDSDQTGKLNVERVYFRALNGENEFSASSIETSNVTNLYAGGVIGLVAGTNVIALDAFKDRFQEVELDGENTINVANYLYEGNYTIEAVQNGTSNAITNGKSIAGGIVGKGYINLDGDLDDRSDFAIASPTSTFVVEGIQSKITNTNGLINDKEHACAALVYGSVGDNSLNIANINVYSNNTTIKTTREIGSTAIGDLHTGGFISYATNSIFSNIGLYLNDSIISAESLSYESTNSNENTNSAFCGGFVGELLNNSSLINVEFAGYDVDYLTIKGTTSHLESIQNTIPGGNNYMGENYLGGIVGRIQYATLSECRFIGGNDSKDYIRMNGHESPDSAFCGGIVGLIMTNANDVSSYVNNCEVTNTEISGYATNNKSYSNPDIYIGGIIGAAYLHATNSIVEVNNCHLKNSVVNAVGNEIIATYAAGIIAGATWQSAISISDCYVTDTFIKSTTTTKVENTNTLEASAAGIIGMCGNATDVSIANCVVIDTDVKSIVNETIYNSQSYISSYGAGISGFTESNTTIPSIENCYSNATVSSKHNSEIGTANIYAIAYNASLVTGTKEVNTTTKVVTYKNFTCNGFTFEVVSTENGTYRIKNSNGSYYRVNWNGQLLTTTSTNWATTFTLINNNIVYNGSYISFNGNAIVYGATVGDFSTVDYSDINDVTGLTSITCNQTYYLNKNVKAHADSIGTAVGTGPFNIIANTPTNPYANYDYLYGYDGVGQKLYFEILDDDSLFEVNHGIDSVTSITSTGDSTTLAHVWINAKALGGETISENVLYVPNHENKEEAASYGWFIFDYVLLYTGDLTSISSNISNIDTNYINETSKYEHMFEDIDNDGNKDHYLVNSNNASDIILNNYVENDIVDNVKEFTFYVYENILTLNVDFEITHFGSNYKLLFADVDGNPIEDAEFKNLYGNVEFKLIQKHSSNGNDLYNLIFEPNEEINDDITFFIRFIGGNNTISCQTTFKINLIANKLQLVGVTYADYSPPINYYENKEDLGTSVLPYHLYVGSVTKFIPIFTKSNDLVKGTKYILEENIEKCDYSIDSTTDQYFDILSNGELKTGTIVNQNGTLTVTYEETTITLYVLSVKEIDVSYSLVGADIQGLTKTSDTTEFYFEHYIRSNYSGVPSTSTITIGNTMYDLFDLENLNEGIKIYEINSDGLINDTIITEYNSDAYGYVIKVDNSLITDDVNNISVEIDYPIVYTITFKLQCETFNNSLSPEDLTKSFKITSGTSFKEYFTVLDNENRIINPTITNWINSAELFGYVFTGFYLVNDANSIHSYGISFEDLASSDYIVNSSLTFYGRWSYLIEIIEASGTYIKTGFNSAFMQEYYTNDFTRAIQIPINANQGYVFRVDTDSNYIGNPGVEAYVVTIDGSGNKVMTEIEIEAYQNSSSLYYIRPEYITGYLIIKTTVSNSEVIVGEHTSSITENIAPEDGIITFKYVVNHYNKDGMQSYIYNLANDKDYNTVPMEFVLDFYKESDHSDLVLPDLTEIRCYYNRYVNGSSTPVETLVGTYITHNDDRVYLTEFKLLDLETNAFPSTTTFGDILGTNESVTEIYYFTITPPNGYSNKVKNEIANYIVECGYVDEKSEPHQEINYLTGERTQTALANPKDLSDVVSPSTDYESSRQYKVYHIIPTRETMLEEEDDGTYTFTDDKTYSVYDIILTDTQKLPDFTYISLYDDTRQSIVESSVMSFNIKKLTLRLGYRLGNVSVYGYDKEHDVWEKVTDINVNSAIYQEYEVDFKDSEGNYPYYAYKIDNTSTHEIRLTNIDVLSGVNGVLYEGNVVDLFEKSVDSVNRQYTYSLEHEIVGDSRHDGKTFMLAIQVADANNKELLISDIIGDIYILINDIGLDLNHYVYLNDYNGKNTAYLNLSEIINVLNVDSINFRIIIPNEYQIYEVQLLEVINEFKPASGEVRVKCSIEHKHYYIGGICACGAIDDGYVSLLEEFSTMLVNDFNNEGQNSDTTITEFYVTSADNIEDIFTDATMLHKYRWFLEYIKSEVTSKAETSNALTDETYINAIELLTKMIGGPFPDEIFTSSDYTSGSELIRYFIDGLINSKSATQLGAPDEYSKFMVDYSDSNNTMGFLNEYEDSKLCISLVKFNDGGLVSGGFTWSDDGITPVEDGVTATINVNYLCTTDVVSANSLVGQSKILLYKIATNTFKIVAVSNSGVTANSLGVEWTHAIATAYPVDYEALYGQYLGDYIVINESTMPSLTTNTSIADYRAMVNLTYEGYFDAKIIENVENTGEYVELTTADRIALNKLVPDIVVNKNFTTGNYVVNGIPYSYGTTAFSSIKDAISNSTAGDSIYVFAGTYTQALTISKANLTIYGPNYDIVAAPMRYDEAIVSNSITISASGVTINGLAVTGSSSSITIGAVSDVTIASVHAANYKDYTVSGDTYKIAIYSVSAITDLIIKDSYFKCDLTAGSNYRPIYLNTGVVTNVTIDNNYIDNGNDNNGVAIWIYKTAGIYRIQNNTINFQSGNNTLYIGNDSNACTEMWIKDNYFTSDGALGVDVTKVATISIFNFKNASGAVNIVGNKFEYVTGGNTFNLTGCTGAVNIKYNYFKDCTFKITNSAVATLANNYYSSVPVKDDADTSSTYVAFLNEYNANPTYTNEQRIEDYENDTTYN